MNRLLDNPDATSELSAVADQYVVSHGKSGGLGCFVAPEPLTLRRGERVVVDSSRGREVGSILCAASIRQARLLGAITTGTVVRRLDDEDESLLASLKELGARVYEAGRGLARDLDLPLEILDVEMLLDRQAILQFLGDASANLDDFAATLGQAFALDIRLENLALPVDQHDEDHGGCGKPDCGREGKSGCSTCGTGGGCSSCGSSKVDMRDYFLHLRTQMEARQRTPLL